MARHHLASALEPEPLDRLGQGRLTSLSTWTRPIVTIFVLIVGLVAALGLWGAVRGVYDRMNPHHEIPSLDEQVHALVHG
jgi:hypothetical protein